MKDSLLGFQLDPREDVRHETFDVDTLEDEDDAMFVVLFPTTTDHSDEASVQSTVFGVHDEQLDAAGVGTAHGNELEPNLSKVSRDILRMET